VQGGRLAKWTNQSSSPGSASYNQTMVIFRLEKNLETTVDI